MAPERLDGPGAGGPESDVYALAAVAYELLSGGPPREPASGAAAAGQPPPDLRRGWPEAPAAVAAVLERGLDPDPARRQPSAGLLVDELEAALSGKGETETKALAGAAAPATAPTRRATATRPSVKAPPPLHRRWNRSAAIAAIGLALAAIAGVAIAGGGGDGDSGDAEPNAASQSPPAAEEQAAEEPAPEEAPADSAGASGDPAALNDQGFALINEGRYDEAIPILEQAVAAFPEGSEDLTYAYALFNLGHALRMAGRPEEAIPILEQRLEIPNQTGTVQRELDAAYADAGSTAAAMRTRATPGQATATATRSATRRRTTTRSARGVLSPARAHPRKRAGVRARCHPPRRALP